MFLVDDILLSPMSGILWIMKEIHKNACQEIDDEPKAIAQQLRLLYMRLETGEISEEEFAESESRWLDRLDEIEAASEDAAPVEEVLAGSE